MHWNDLGKPMNSQCSARVQKSIYFITVLMQLVEEVNNLLFNCVDFQLCYKIAGRTAQIHKNGVSKSVNVVWREAPEEK